MTKDTLSQIREEWSGEHAPEPHEAYKTVMYLCARVEKLERVAETSRDALGEHKRIRAWATALKSHIYPEKPVQGGPPSNELVFIANKMEAALRGLEE